jgi:hypothetical protein
MFEERALDGCNIHVGHPAQFRRFLDDVVPILRERGLLRTEYESETLRGDLGIPVPENRHTRARQEARGGHLRRFCRWHAVVAAPRGHVGAAGEPCA